MKATHLFSYRNSHVKFTIEAPSLGEALADIKKIVKDSDKLVYEGTTKPLVKKGSVLIAKNVCKMDGFTNEKTLTIGKEYKVKRMDKNMLIIIDDERTEHQFATDDTETFTKFFDIKQK